MGELPRPRMANERISSRSISPSATRHAFRDRLLGARSHPSVDFSAAGLITSAPPNALAAGCPRSIATATSRARPRRNSASSCAPSDAASRNSSRGSGRRTRSSAWKPNCDAPGAPARESSTRSGAPFSSESRPRRTSGGTRSPHEARGIWPHRVMTRGRRIKGARDVRGRGGGLSDPRPLGRQPTTHAPSSRSLLLDRGLSAGLGSNVFLVILVGRHRRRHGPQRGKQPARARHDDCEHMRGYATPASRPRIPRSSSPPPHEAARTVTTQA